MKKVLSLAVLLASLVLAAPAAAGVPDGPGPWADSVVDFDQGLRANGTPVLATRSNPMAALGVAENTLVEGTFVSLGFGGTLTLGYENNICNQKGSDLDLELTETTLEPYPPELVDVYVSVDGDSYVLAASNVDKDAVVGLPASVKVARYVRVIDRSDPALFANRPNPADGYDVDGIRALSTECKDPKPEKQKCNSGRGNGSEGCDPGKSSTSPDGSTGQNQGGDEGGPIRGGTGAP